MEKMLKNKVERDLGRDITVEFMNHDSSDFGKFLRTVQVEPCLVIRLDLTRVQDRHEFVSLARRAKAFLEVPKPAGQQRDASIKCTETQKKLEPNVFASGVIWERA